MFDNRAINFFTYGNGKRILTDIYGQETALVHSTAAIVAGSDSWRLFFERIIDSGLYICLI